MIYPRRFPQSVYVPYRRTSEVAMIWRLLQCMLAAAMVLLAGFILPPPPQAAAQDSDPGATDPMVPVERRYLFPDQHALIAMPWNPTLLNPPVTYTDWARSQDLKSMVFQDAMVPGLQGIREARAAAGHILSQEDEQVAVGRFTGSGTSNIISVDVLTPSGTIAAGAGATVSAFSTSALYEAPVPNSFDVATGSLSSLIDEDGIEHDEVVVCRFLKREMPVIGSVLAPTVTVLDYTALTESGVTETTLEYPHDLVLFNALDWLVLETGSDSLISCGTGDLNGDGVDEIVVAYLRTNTEARVSVLRYTNDGENPPQIERVGNDLVLKPIRNQTISGNPLFWGDIDLATGDFNADGGLDVGVSVVNWQDSYPTWATYPGIQILSSDANFNLTRESRFAEFEPAWTSRTEFNDGTGSYACRPTPSDKACETTRAELVSGLFKFHPPSGYNFDRRQLAVVYNMPYAQGGGLRAVALDISDDLKTVTPLGDPVTLPQQSCDTGLCPSAQRFSVSPGGFAGAGDISNPLWSLVVTNWEATRDGTANGTSAGQFHGFWLQGVPVDADGSGGGLALVWDEVLLKGHDISGPTNARLPAVAWDRTGASLYLGSPVHIVVYDLIRTEFIIEEPPKHTYWWPPDATDPADGEIMNVSRDDDFFIKLSDTQNRNYAESSRNITDWSIGGSVTASAKGSVTASKDAGIFKTKATASVEVVGKISYDYNENKDAYEKNYREQEETFTGTTERDDLLIAKLQTYDVWRYPISGIALDDDLYPFWEISFPGKVLTEQGGGLSMMDWFTPPYENGNILSYPLLTGASFTPSDCCAEFTFIEEGQEATESIPFLDGRLLVLGGTGATYDLTFSEESGEGETKTYNKELSESLDVTVGFKASSKIAGIKSKVEGSVGVNINNSNSWSDIQTTDSSTNNSTGFKLNVPARNANQSYKFAPVFYLAKDGTTKVSHAVDILGTGATFWTETYGSLPDPAVKLPKRFSAVAFFMGRTIWEPNGSADAKQIRGFTTRYAEPGQDGTYALVAGALTEGDKVRLEVDVHNYSVGRGVQALPVRFEAAQLNDTMNQEVSRVPVTCGAGSTLLLTLDPLESASAVCVWDTAGFGPGIPGSELYYRIYVTLDPEDEIEEIYEGTVGPGQNNEGWSLLSVADPELTFAVPTPTEKNPLGADVSMAEAALAIQVSGKMETEFARVVASQLTPLRVCVDTDQTQTGNHHVQIYDGDPSEGGVLIADKLIPGINEDGGTCVWVPDFRFQEPGDHTLFARVLETREDAQVGNAGDTLLVSVDPIPVLNPYFAEGKAADVGSGASNGTLTMSGSFRYDGSLNLPQSILVMGSVLNEAGGAGELIPGVQALTGQNLVLFARPEGSGSVRFQTPDTRKPGVQVDLSRREGWLDVQVIVSGAEILEPSQCGGTGEYASTRLTTELALFDDTYPPVYLNFADERWKCETDGHGWVTNLQLFQLPPHR